ncbi:MAG TPA: FKBP-type peptidyl-prolyl cis-trans isomerase [Mycobacteriales bacterium]|nr:FKBP-type peptidyl-prolyl cis-trans isomerase [Mycobacteriales bacterium]
MATSRRRERELARRRYERRRQAEIERRAQAKRRNTIIGAVTGTAVVVAVLLILTFTVFTGGGSGKKAGGAGSTVSPSASTSTSPTPAAPKTCATIKPNPPTKGSPVVPQVKGPLTDKLVTKDVTVGHGPAAKKGATVKVLYTGVSCDTGKVFDASWLHPPVKTFPVSPLGSASVIPGWNQGLIGMKAGGTRELIIPAALGYGAAGQPSAGIEPNDTLVFLVEAKSVKNPS